MRPEDIRARRLSQHGCHAMLVCDKTPANLRRTQMHYADLWKGPHRHSGLPLPVRRVRNLVGFEWFIKSATRRKSSGASSDLLLADV